MILDRYRVVFWLFRPKKWLCVRLHCKSHKKSSKCQIFQWVWHLVIFRADQLKRPPCTMRKLKNFGFIDKSHFCFFQLYLMYSGLFTLHCFLVWPVAMDLTYMLWLFSPRKEKVWKYVSIGFVVPLGHSIYRQRSEQLVVLSSTFEGQPQSKDYD